jgi:hypothetical protein
MAFETGGSLRPGRRLAPLLRGRPSLGASMMHPMLGRGAMVDRRWIAVDGGGGVADRGRDDQENPKVDGHIAPCGGVFRLEVNYG